MNIQQFAIQVLAGIGLCTVICILYVLTKTARRNAAHKRRIKEREEYTAKYGVHRFPRKK
jgi:hypothetical protein